MSKHWKPDEDVARVRESRAKPAWPKGATAGVVLVAAACAGLAIIVYQVMGPRDIFAP